LSKKASSSLWVSRRLGRSRIAAVRPAITPALLHLIR
jgi:hypothetical protein